ncbi:unnamed protein product [marine sediment metagenome]|uniref:Uncharacterized protein n=1 Tax=marine sediment metagenome TaxID=412755 RepID=X1HLV6_9ZZZZ
MRAGGTLEQAGSVLRHLSTETTKIYTATFADEKRLSDPAEFLIDQLY